MKALILSGGKGTRLRPFTYTRAKQLIPVANKPVLIRAIETIREAGITEIGIVIGTATGAEIRAAVGDGSAYSVSITYIEQASPDGLAHAVRIAQQFIGDSRFVMYLGDNVLQGGIASLVHEYSQHTWNSQILLKQMPDPRSFGVAVLRADGSIERLVEKPPVPPSDLALIGVYMFDNIIFEAVNAIQPSPRGEYEITDAIQWLVDQGCSVHAHIHRGWFFDTGKPIDMIDANCNVLDTLVPMIDPHAVVIDSQIDSRVTIERGARVVNSTIHGPTIIGEDTLIENSYVGPYTSIYHHVTVVNSEIERSIILEESVVENVPTRLHGCMIGRHVTLSAKTEKPHNLTMNLGDHSTVWLA
ncbi:MAG: glucose-1-phosphate thymidylyltransferase [Chloroflexota bacterium]|nr:glucose-1-phosphate thymidylyltransferase [Chloroflexota bacterium]